MTIWTYNRINKSKRSSYTSILTSLPGFWKWAFTASENFKYDNLNFNDMPEKLAVELGPAFDPVVTRIYALKTLYNQQSQNDGAFSQRFGWSRLLKEHNYRHIKFCLDSTNRLVIYNDGWFILSSHLLNDIRQERERRDLSTYF